ncbi:YfbK domain-containing protein [Chitinophaga pinensis]|uniref:von Willebrand factor type A n=1 Tax=Chitinophaga pinensis (strain ATCC 43595 / DSM 2588 / LMG 13176 / NBRC 15968 / NCIMB 11800 / UQM 2034) TaxID=485918 RepID=A0A979GWY8_CHIPD|nr:von Willebrand factor type A domain-containing protein [Chitinophaga pinensis]ACU64308.1 von Willebrand factor type A [Chitinophaga pinensis DSM 2588]
MQRLLTLLASLIILVPGSAQKIWISGAVEDSISHNPLAGVIVTVVNDTARVITNQYGLFRIAVPSQDATLLFQHSKYFPKQLSAGAYSRMLVQMNAQEDPAEDAVKKAKAIARERSSNGSNPNYGNALMGTRAFFDETYGTLYENKFIAAETQIPSLFAVDVDRAAYSNIRRFVKLKERIPANAVRIEEMVNYFHYSYPLPPVGQTLAIYSNYATCPWAEDHRLLQIAVRGKSVNLDSLPPSNLVFLIDVSGSMAMPNKLPLLQAAFRILVNNLRSNDHVAIVAYAGVPGVILPSTPGSAKSKILNAIDYLSAGGATAGEAAIKLAYQIAEENFIKEGNNRVILATDGDFNVGQTSDHDMEQLILGKKETGVLLTCLGFGMKNYKDSKLETLSSKGNGNFAYIDNLEEASKIFAREFGSTLFTVARDVQADVVFNPRTVKSYRLIGYENKVIKDDDSASQIGGGIIGAGHCAVAIYEIVPQKGLMPADSMLAAVHLAYRETTDTTIKRLFYKVPDIFTTFQQSSDDFRFASAVALMGMLLRKSGYKGSGSCDMVMDIARRSLGDDPGGYRREFITLLKDLKKSKNLEK